MPTPLILLSGMGADERVFERQLKAFPQAICPKWIPARPGELLGTYAKRFAGQLREQFRKKPLFLGGASFGGFVASEMARYLSPRALMLVGSVLSPDELPPKITALRRLAPISLAVPFSLVRPLCRLVLSAPDSSINAGTKHIFAQAADADAQFLRWACGAVLKWKPNPRPISCPVYDVHGSADRVLPIRYTHPTHIVRGAGHVLSMSHATELNAIIREMIKGT